MIWHPIIYKNNALFIKEKKLKIKIKCLERTLLKKFTEIKSIHKIKEKTDKKYTYSINLFNLN